MSVGKQNLHPCGCTGRQSAMVSVDHPLSWHSLVPQSQATAELSSAVRGERLCEGV